MNIFNITITAPEIRSQQFLEALVTSAAKKEDERRLVRSFLESPSLVGQQRIIEVIDQATTKAGLNESCISELKPAVFDFYLNQARIQKNQVGLTLYQDLILRVIESDSHFRHQDIACQIREGKQVTDIPPTYPGEVKKAQVLVDGQISSSIGKKETREYFIRKNVQTQVNDIAKDVFYGINHGLTNEQSYTFSAVMYELNKIKTAESISPTKIKEIIANAIKNKTPLELLHIKSIRFTYPGGSTLKVLEDTASMTQLGHLGESRTYPSEETIFTRLQNVGRIFSSFSVLFKTTLIVSNHDLGYCFPPQQKIVFPDDVGRASISVEKYINYLRNTHPEIDTIRTLSEYLSESGINERYEKTFDALVFQGEGGSGQNVSAKILEMRVNSQYEHYSQMFKSYTRELARITAIRQIANILALSVIFESFSTSPLLVIDSRGFEDHLIGGFNPKSVGKFFTKLKDPTIIK